MNGILDRKKTCLGVAAEVSGDYLVKISRSSKKAKY